ncbi:MAG: 50S ribosomal protein L10 [Aquificaceae bacterium]|nr:50S ribosomal protein L10 [Aquificaceae bacterium]
MKKSWVLKQELIDSISERYDRSNLLVFFDFTGLDAQFIAKFRSDVKQAHGEVLVCKNTLLLRALSKTPLVDYRHILAGPTASVFSYQDPVSIAKLIYDSLKELDKDNPLARVKGALFSNRLLSKEDVQALAQLPPKEVLVSKLLGVLKSPAFVLVSALNSPVLKLIMTLKAIEENLKEVK